MDQYASMLHLFILLLHGYAFAVDTEHALTARSLQDNGAWINKGVTYSHCASTQFEKGTCANFSLIQRPVTKNQALRPDCAFLLHRIACALYKLNCPSYPESSFQMYDIPCQSSCHATVDICVMRMVRSQHQQQRSHSSSRVWQTYPKRSASVYYPGSSPAYLHQTLPTWQPQPIRSPLTTVQSVWPWRPYVPQRVTANQRRIPRTSLDSSREGENDSIWNLRHEDCHFLPSGGCDDWARRLARHYNYYNRDYVPEVLQNSACPQDYQVDCSKMFPTRFTKSDWQKGNFTVALVMRISQTFWWFGKFNRFQPFFRFNVKRTLKSDIVEYNDKIILTNTWPSPCVCPNKLVVGKKYVLLTHSRVSRQTLRISTRSVFLEKPKRYVRLILCWMGSCPWQSHKNRGQERGRWNWRWQTRRR